MVIGLGTGASAGWLGAAPSFDRVDVVELEPAVVDVARDCTPINEDVLNNERVRVIIGDAREVLPTARDRYDLIMSAPSNPYRAGIASLFTREYYQAVDERLAEGGIFLQWMQDYEVDARTIQTVYATIGTAFPFVETWVSKSGSDMILVATRKELRHDLAALSKRVSEEPYRSALLRAWGVNGVEGLFSGFVAAPGLAEDLAKGPQAEVSTDDNSLVEFGFARSVGRTGLFDLAELRAYAEEHGYDQPNVVGTLNKERVAELRIARTIAENRFPVGLKIPPGPVGHRYRARQSYAWGDLKSALMHWQSQNNEPDNPTDRTLLSEAMAVAGSDAGEALIQTLSKDQPLTASVLRARWLASRGQLPKARSTMLQALKDYQTNPWPMPTVMKRALELAQQLAMGDRDFAMKLFGLLREPFSLDLLSIERTTLRARIGFGLDFQNLCVDALAPLEPHVPWEEEILKARASCYSIHKHERLDLARAELVQFLNQEPPHLSTN